MTTGYQEYGKTLGELLIRNQSHYGDSFGQSGDVLRILYPHGIRPNQYDDALAITRIIDKLFRVANGSQGNESPYKDIAGYGVLGWARQERARDNGE